MTAITAAGGSLALAEADLDLLLLIRRFEQTLLDLFASGQLSGTTHTCLGQEYIPVALAPLLRGDFVFSNHRGHGHYLAHQGDPEGLLAEIMGRDGAVCRGAGGSQHLYGDGFLSTGVQGESLPAAVGVALHCKRAPGGRVVAAYIGDGTWGEGAVYEALNLAALWRVPLLVVVEDNGIAQSTPTGHQLAGTIAGRAAAFGIDFVDLATRDVDLIRATLDPRLDRMRAEPAPLVVRFETVRLGPHSRGDDTRPAGERESLRARDWYPEYERALGERFAAADARAGARMAELVRTVSARPLSTWDGPDAG